MQTSSHQDSIRTKWIEDPARFAKDCLGLQLWHRQVEILRAVTKHPRVAVRSGHKCGKSSTLVVAALWFALTRKRARVVLTSSSARQVREILWRELKQRYRAARFPIGGKLAELPSSGLRFGDGREIVGFTTKDAEKMAGISGENVLFVIDEASGFPEPLFEAIEGNRAGGARTLLASNPTQLVGEFHAAFHSKRSLYCGIHMSSEETPNVTGVGVSIPGLAIPEWIEEKRAEWGEDSPLFQVRVKGNFATLGDARIVPLSLVDLGHARYDDTPADGPLHLGLDVARDGNDETICCVRRGRKVLVFETFPNTLTGPQLAVEVATLAMRYRKTGERPKVKIDRIGVGVSPYDSLRLRTDLDTIGVISSRTADDEEKYTNLRTQLCFGVRDWLNEGGSFPPDDKADQELVQQKYTFDSQGRFKAQSKDEIKAAIQRSPDRADALALAVYSPVSTPAESADTHQAHDTYRHAVSYDEEFDE